MRYVRLRNISLFISLCFTLAACGGKTEDEASSDTAGSVVTEEEALETAADIDLTPFSGTMAYAEISNMQSSPDDYPEIFSDIVITGEFQTYERNGNVYCNLVDVVIE